MLRSQDKQHEFNVLKAQYNGIVGSDGNQFLYSTTPESTTYYVFRDTKVSGIQAAIDLMKAVVDAHKPDAS